MISLSTSCPAASIWTVCQHAWQELRCGPDGEGAVIQDSHCCTQVVSSDEDRVATWRQLAQSWQDTWLRWDSQRDRGESKSQAEVDEEQRMAFVRSLVAQASSMLQD